jgi:hypothetical protein
MLPQIQIGGRRKKIPGLEVYALTTPNRQPYKHLPFPVYSPSELPEIVEPNANLSKLALFTFEGQPFEGSAVDFLKYLETLPQDNQLIYRTTGL